MKNIFERLALMLLSLTMFAACQEDEGTDPGHDSTPVASVYKYTAGDGYNADNDCRFRVITNSAVQEVYYLAQLNDEKKALNMTDQQYADYVVEKGTKLDLKAASDTDVYVTCTDSTTSPWWLSAATPRRSKLFSSPDWTTSPTDRARGPHRSSAAHGKWMWNIPLSATATASRASIRMGMASPSRPTAPT